jgi:hypothetical protein
VVQQWSANSTTVPPDAAVPAWERVAAGTSDAAGAQWSMSKQMSLFGREVSPVVALGALLVLVVMVWALVSGTQQSSDIHEELDRVREGRMERLDEIRSRRATDPVRAWRL